MDEVFTDERLDEIVDWVESAYPEEGCGLILRDEESGERRILKTDNLANQYHEMDPDTYPRTADKFYVINPMEFVKAEDRGEVIEAVFHSHVDTGDYFSEEDVNAATMPRESEDDPYEEAHPGADYLVVSVRDGSASSATLFRFDEESGTEPFPPVLEIDIDGGAYELSPVE